MRDILKKAFEHSISETRRELTLMPLSRWNESVFRFGYSRAVAMLAPDVEQFFEADRIDLVLHWGAERAFMEFKFYIHRAAHNPLSAQTIGTKGGPSLQNCLEFEKSVKTLRDRSAPTDVLKLVALFYSDPASTTSKTYDSCYGDGSGIEQKLNIFRLISVSPFQTDSSDNMCYARLFEVGA